MGHCFILRIAYRVASVHYLPAPARPAPPNKTTSWVSTRCHALWQALKILTAYALTSPVKDILLDPPRFREENLSIEKRSPIPQEIDTKHCSDLFFLLPLQALLSRDLSTCFRRATNHMATSRDLLHTCMREHCKIWGRAPRLHDRGPASPPLRHGQIIVSGCNHLVINGRWHHRVVTPILLRQQEQSKHLQRALAIGQLNGPKLQLQSLAGATAH